MFYIDTDDYASSGIEVFQFPGGEWHANVPRWRTKLVHVFAKIRTWDDMGKLLVVGSALKTQEVDIHVFAPYFPGARQDRNPEGLTPLTSELYGKLFATFATSVTCVDVHSHLSVMNYYSGTDKHLRSIDPVDFLEDLIKNTPDAIIAPDKGAIDRASRAADLFQCKVIRCDKVRDFQTGELTGFSVPSWIKDDYPSRSRFLIVDDICDGGGTFVGLIEEFRKIMPEAPVDLYVTHGIFSKGLGPLSVFDNIYTTNSFYQRPDHGDVYGEFIHNIDLLPYYFGGLRP